MCLLCVLVLSHYFTRVYYFDGLLGSSDNLCWAIVVIVTPRNTLFEIVCVACFLSSFIYYFKHRSL